MNFLLNALEVPNDGDFDDDGGWGSDIDLSDSEVTGNESGPQQTSLPEQPSTNIVEENPIRMGGGMIMGRLTQFLDVVAPPLEDEDFGDGWGNDDDVDVEGWEDDDAQEVLSMLDKDDDAGEDISPENDAPTFEAVLPTPSIQSTPVVESASVGAETLSTSMGIGMPSVDGFGDETNPETSTQDEGEGWADDGVDLSFDDNEVAETIETEQPVIRSPPPPPPPIQPMIAHSNGYEDKVLDLGGALDLTTALQSPPPVTQSLIPADGNGDDLPLEGPGDGWGDEDGFDIADDDLGADTSLDNDDSNNVVVDHIPPPPPPNQGNIVRNDTFEDDISQDDTLSMANSRTQQNAGLRMTSMSTIGDMDDYDPSDEYATRSVSTVGSGSAGGGRLASRKVVDCTPRQAFHRGGDASLMVAGHTSVGESLDSIDEANEEDYENDIDIDNARRLNTAVSSDFESSLMTPRTMESGWGALKHQHQERHIGSTEVPFGSALTPTATNGNALSDFDASSENNNSGGPETTVGVSNESEGKIDFPLVDQTPEATSAITFGEVPISRKASIANSVDVLSVSSEEGDLGESDTVGVDDIKEELYGPMVDQIPPAPKDDFTRKQRMLSGQASVEGGGSTVVGQAENKDVANDIREDDAMDEEEEDDDDVVDESGKGWASTMAGEFDNRSLLSGLPLPVVDETQYLVDHVPVDQLLRGRASGGNGAGAASLMVMMDASTASSRAEDNVVDDGSNPVNFGPIVDHTPALNTPVGIRRTLSVTTSVATAMSGLEGDIKEDDDMDNTTVEGGSGDGGNPDSIDDPEGNMTEPEASNNLGGDHIVDHVPEGKTQRTTQDASVCVLVGKDDDMTQVDTIVGDVALNYGPIVDHTPVPSSSAPSGGLSVGGSLLPQRNVADDNNTATIGSISEQDGNSGWDHDEPDLDDFSGDASNQGKAFNEVTKEENNLVDHIPKRSFSKPVDGSTIVLIDPVDAVSEVDDADDDTVGNARTDKFGPVVDHTPAPRSNPVSLTTSMINQGNEGNRNFPDVDGSATWFGASTLGGVSSAAADGSLEADDDSGTGWDEDDQVLKDLASPAAPSRHIPIQNSESHLVDHVPPLVSPRPADANASTAVAIDPSVISGHTQDDKIGGGIFGAVVDHTPSIEPVLNQSGNNSTLVTGIANTKRDEDLDETTWQGGVSAQGEGWDQDDPELEDLANETEDTSPHVVDHVPERPESRYADQSLVVAANPSDMSSQVEDLNQDENHFGPVVDQTPLERVLPPPAVGSTVVALPSILNDVSDEGDGEEQNTEGARVPNEWEDQLPNPQSGNETETENEQLVDTVPPPLEPLRMGRDASSEMATVDDKSTIAPADEQKEDEFGPVVDQTPSGDDADSSNGVNRSDREETDEDQKPAANLDSVAPNFSVESNEKEDGLEEDEFGPVVDQLPVVSSRSSLAPSKGGSTVDALATVSEGEDDFNTRDGWDDDTLDVIDQASPANTSHRANYSVTWDDNIYKKDVVNEQAQSSSEPVVEASDSGFFSAEMNVSAQTDLDETKFYDPELTAMNGWAVESLNIADDETPPSTPRMTEPFQSNVLGGCPSCSNAEGIDCPCIEALLETNGGKKDMVGLLKTPKGDSVKIDFRKLLQNETAKRILLEKESEALREMVKSLKLAKESLVAAGEKQMMRENEMFSAINKWEEANGELSVENTKCHDANRELSSENQKFSSQLSQLKSKNDVLTSELKSLNATMSLLEDEKVRIQTRENALSNEITNLKASLEKQQLQSASDANLQAQLSSIQMEISFKDDECAELKTKLAFIETKLRESEAQNFTHAKDIAKMTQNHSRQTAELQERLDAYSKDLEESRTRNDSEIEILKEKLSYEKEANQRLQGMHDSLAEENRDLQSQVHQKGQEQQHELIEGQRTMKSLQTDLTNTKAENSQLCDQVNKYAEELGRLSSLSTELNSISRERDVLKEALVESKTHIAGLQKQFDDLKQVLQLNVLEPESMLNAIKADRAKQSLEVEALQKRINDIDSEKKDLERKFEAFKKMHTNSVQAAASSALNAVKEEAKVKKLDGELKELRKGLQDIRSRKEESENECNRLSTRCSELENEVSRLSEMTGQLQKLQNELVRFEKLVESKKLDIKSLELNLSEQGRLLTLKDDEIVNLRSQHASQSSRLTEVETEKRNLLYTLERSQARVVQLESMREDAEGKILDIDRLKEEVDALVSERDRLQNELTTLAYERDALEKEKVDLNIENEEMLVQFGLLNEEMVEKEEELRILQEQVEFHEKQVREYEEELLARDQELNAKDQVHLEELNAKDQELNAKDQVHLEELNAKDQVHLEELNAKDQVHLEELNAKDQVHLEELNAKDQVHLEELNAKDQELQLARRSSQEYHEKLQLSEEKLNALIEESEELTKGFDDVDNNTTKLVDINRALRDKIFEMKSEQSAANDQLKAMESHKLGLAGKVEDLQNLVDELIASFETREGKLQSTIDGINFEMIKHREKSITQQAEIARLNEQVVTSNGFAEECAKLRSIVSLLENQISEQDRILLQKDAAAQDLFNQLQNNGNSPLESAELEMLRETVQENEARIAQDKEKLHDMNAAFSDAQQELTITMEQLKSSQEIAQQLQDDLQSKQSVEATNQMLESRLDQLEQELMSARSGESKYCQEVSSLKEQLSDLSHQNSSRTSNDVEELLALRRQVEDLKREKDMRSSEAAERENVFEQELCAFKQQMIEKDNRIVSLEDKLEAIGCNLSKTKKESNDKQESIESLTNELNHFKTIASDPSTKRMLEVARSQAENIEGMRSQIVALAQALEKSEFRRAEVIDNVERERQAHADSLRRMTVNVKRFYATLNMGER